MQPCCCAVSGLAYAMRCRLLVQEAVIRVCLRPRLRALKSLELETRLREVLTSTPDCAVHRASLEIALSVFCGAAVDSLLGTTTVMPQLTPTFVCSEYHFGWNFSHQYPGTVCAGLSPTQSDTPEMCASDLFTHG
eukprot:3698148-Rhodomonas_salina.1